MKTMEENINEWLIHEAHIVAGHAFRVDDCSCVPVWPELRSEDSHKLPKGFLVTEGSEVTYFDAHTPQGAQMCHAWQKYQLSEILAKNEDIPAECWVG